MGRTLRDEGEGTTRIVRTGNGDLHKSATSFTARQTFARLIRVDEKRGLMGAHTALSRKIQPRHEKINAELLTPRQREILRLVSIGHTNREIADVLEISVRTVEVHRFNLMRRLNVRNVAQLLRRALQLGLLAKTFGAK